MANINRRAAALGGRVHIQSRPGRGTTIELEAPLQSGTGFLP
jgi:signal transduction histidine kinase